jgi:hypothetical protein
MVNVDRWFRVEPVAMATPSGEGLACTSYMQHLSFAALEGITSHMHSKRFMIFAAAICVAAMLSYLFVFADAPEQVELVPATPPAPAAPQ